MVGAGWGEVREMEGEGGISLLTEAKQRGTVHRSVSQVLYIIDPLRSNILDLDLENTA